MELTQIPRYISLYYHSSLFDGKTIGIEYAQRGEERESDEKVKKEPFIRLFFFTFSSIS